MDTLDSGDLGLWTMGGGVPVLDTGAVNLLHGSQ